MQLTVNKCKISTWLCALLALLAVAGLAAGCLKTEPPERLPVQILAINDFHGQVIPGKKVQDRPVGSAPVLAAYLRKAQKDFAGYTFIVSAGDLIGASPPESALLQDEPAIMFMNSLGNDRCIAQDRLNPGCNLVATLGNHEFDDGVEELQRLLQGGNHAKGPFLEDPWRGANFPYVAANVVREDTGKTLFPPYVIKEVDGLPIAFIGGVLKGTKDMVMPSRVVGLRFLEEAQAINAYIPELKDKGVRTIIVLLHQGGREEAYEGPTRPGDHVSGAIKKVVWLLDDEVDVVVSGHTHAFTNALIPNRNRKEILVTQAWSAGAGFGDIILEIDRKTRDVVKKSATVITTWANAGPGLAPDPEAAQLMQAAQARVAPLTRRPIALVAADIVRAQNAAGESPLGNLIADSQRQAMGTDFAFMNPGGIRTNVPAGEVTWGQLYAVLPFNNYLVKMELTGQQIYDLLNQQFPLGQSFHRLLQISGLTYTWDNKLPPPGCIVEVRKDGKPLDRAATYTVTVNNFLAEGGDRFPLLTEGANQVTGPQDLKTLCDYLQSLPQPVNAKIEGRIEKLN